MRKKINDLKMRQPMRKKINDLKIRSTSAAGPEEGKNEAPQAPRRQFSSAAGPEEKNFARQREKFCPVLFHPPCRVSARNKIFT